MQSDFNVWDASDPVDYQAWLRFWNLSPEREVSSHPDYANLFKSDGDRVLCAAYTSPAGAVLYPFISREIPVSIPSERRWRDITTPYGYGGPLAWNQSNAEELAAQFWKLFDAWAMAHDVVAEFIRFGLFPEMFLPYPGDKVCRSQNIIRSLELDDDAMFMSFESKVRKNVKKATRNGLSILIDEDGSHLADFMRIYESTMDRRSASSGYYFSQSFFESIQHKLPGQFIYAHVCHDGKIVSTELVLVSEFAVYSFLGGTDREAFDLRPNDFLKHEVIRWARGNGKRHFILGGGASPGDGIERYKKAFAPTGAVDFVTGQRILRPDVYKELVQKHYTMLRRDHDSDESAFFPEYRRTI